MTNSTPDTCHSKAAPAFARNGDWLVVLILSALAAFLAFSYFDGRVAKAVKSSYVWMTPATAVVLILMAAACVRNMLRRLGASCQCHGAATPWGRRLLCVAILVTPIVFSLVVNPRDLSMEAKRKRRKPAPSLNAGFHQALAWVLGQEAGPDGPEQTGVSLPPDPTVLDVFALANGGGAAELEGRFVTLVGQCDPFGGPGAARFDLYRLVVTCCIADASSVALEVDRPVNAQLQPGVWVRAAGNLRFENRGGSTVPVLHAATITRIPEPSSPYL